MLDIDDDLPAFEISKVSPVKSGDIVEFAVENNKTVVVKSKGISPIGFARVVYYDLFYRKTV